MEDKIIKYLPQLELSGVRGPNFGVIVDTETTSLDSKTNQIMEFTALKFYYDDDFNITAYDAPVSMLNEPTIPITEESSVVTGLRLEDVAGHHINPADIDNLLNGASVIIAHNARFDRATLERNFNINDAIWACSINDIDWKAQGINTRNQEFIAYKYGFWYNAHRSEEDCMSLLYIIAQKANFLEIVAKSMATSYTVVFQDTLFAEKDILKDAGAQWDGDGKFWYMDQVVDLDAIVELNERLSKSNTEVFENKATERYKK